MLSGMRFLFSVWLVATLFACSDPGVPLPDGGMDAGRTDGSGGCEAPTELCGTRCVNVMNDGRNCGSCGMECAAGSFCSSGVCSRTCPSGTTACGGDCADFATDRNHCGDCDTVCAADQDCRGGACTCPEGYTTCDGSCVDPETDASNCGVCGRTCATDEVCSMGMCTCGAGARESECNDMMDDDCDGMIDCDDPDCADATRPCMGMCGAGVETCDGAGSWGMCEGGDGGMEICGDGIDQDCDGVDTRNPDMYEPNDDCGSCALISMETDPVITIQARFDSVDDNVDCYRFIADDSIYGENIDVSLTNIPAGHDYDVFLYRNYDDCVSRTPLVSGTNFDNADENICWPERFALDDGGTYYIRVTRFRGQSCTDDYSLHVDGLNDPRPCP